MDFTKALTLLPAKLRQRIYIALGLAAAVLTAAGAVLLVSPYPVPWWVGGGLAGIGVLAGPFAVLAAGNVTTDEQATQTEQGEREPVEAEPVEWAEPEQEPVEQLADDQQRQPEPRSRINFGTLPQDV